ncbi:MAG TPA: hypothetical protein VEK79_08810 [Thermoanaerobaculia bacterium]|nr:hypothetical protein [Thermoanaerobaculia bacterium]
MDHRLLVSHDFRAAVALLEKDSLTNVDVSRHALSALALLLMGCRGEAVPQHETSGLVATPVTDVRTFKPAPDPVATRLFIAQPALENERQLAEYYEKRGFITLAYVFGRDTRRSPVKWLCPVEDLGESIAAEARSLAEMRFTGDYEQAVRRSTDMLRKHPRHAK